VARTQPAKFAAMEGQFQTEASAPIRVGGFPDEAARTTRYALEIPYLLSFLAHGDLHARVTGLEAFPEADWPPVGVVHLAFDVMVGCGVVMALVVLLGAWIAWRTRRLPDARWYLNLLVAAGPLGMIAIEAGWTVTEVGRQPWIIHGIMRTADAVSPMPGLWIPFVTVSALYLFLGFVVVFLLRRHVFASPR
jgi:cytochrome d ubiquinol oxidase subunit I